jgi:Eisosome component PIL1
LLARQGRKLLNLLDDTPVVPGDKPPRYAHETKGHEILSEAEGSLRAWEPKLEPVHSQAGDLKTNVTVPPLAEGTVASPTATSEAPTAMAAGDTKEGEHLAHASDKRELAAAPTPV